MGIFNGGSFPTSGGTTIISQDGDQTLTLVGSILTISGTNSSVDLSGFLDDTNTTNTSLVLGVDNVLTLTDSASNTVTADLSSLLDDTNTTNTTLVLNGNILELTDSDANTITADLSGLTPATPTLQEVTDAGNGTTNHLNIAADLDGITSIGRAKMGALISDYLYWSHYDHFTTSSYAINQNSAGSTSINAPTNQNVALKINNSDVLTVKGTNNNIGINKTAPDAKLHIVGGAAAGGGTALLVENSDGDDLLKVDDNSDTTVFGELKLAGYTSTFYDGTPNKFLGVDASGNVIKTSSVLTSTPTLQEVTDAGATTTNDIVLSNAKYFRSNTSTGGNVRMLGINAGNVAYVGAIDSGVTGTIFNASSTSNYAAFYQGGSEKMRIHSTGAVGIGTSNPSKKLHILNSTNEAQIRLGQSGSGSYDLGVYANDTFSIGRDADTQEFNIKNGYIGIGTTNPDAPIDVINTSTSLLGRFGNDNSPYYINIAGIRTFLGYNQADLVLQGGVTKGISFYTNSSTFSDSAVQRMKIDTNGNIGIGTSSPSAKLTISTDEVSHPVKIINTIAGGDFLVMEGDAGDNVFEFDSGGTGGEALQLMYKDGALTNRISVNGNSYFNGGNVGIGTSSPATKLHVGSGSGATISSAYQIAIDGNAITGLQILSGNTQSGRIVFGDAEDNDIGMLLYDHSNDSLRTFVNAAERMRITDTGNVGIGTSSPSAKLHVQRSDDGIIGIFRGTSNAQLLLSVNSGNLEYDASNGNANHVFKNNAAERMRITSTGLVGIGTSSPSAKTHILGAAQGDEVLRLGTAVTDRGLKVTTFAAGTQGNAGVNFDAFWSTDAALSFSTKGTEALYIDGSQNIGIGTSSPSAKTHIVGGAAAGGGTALLVENGAGDDLLKVEDNSDTTVFGELKLAGYTSTFYDGTPNKFLGVDASGNVIKTSSVLTSTPTLQQVIDAGGSYSGTDDNVSIVCGGEGELSLSSHITAITSTGGVTTVNGSGVNIGGSSTVNINPTAGGVHILPTVGDVNIDPVDGDINLTPPSGHKIYAGGTGAKFQIPTWATSSDRPTVTGFGDAGVIGYNIADAALELWNGSAWVTI